MLPCLLLSAHSISIPSFSPPAFHGHLTKTQSLRLCSLERGFLSRSLSHVASLLSGISKTSLFCHTQFCAVLEK